MLTTGRRSADAVWNFGTSDLTCAIYLRMNAMSTKQKRTIGVGVLLAGYSALLAGLFGLTAKPLIGVLLALGGMALSICSAAELVQDRPDADSAPSGSASSGR